MKKSVCEDWFRPNRNIYIPSQSRIKISAKGDTCFLLGVKGLSLYMLMQVAIMFDHGLEIVKRKSKTSTSFSTCTCVSEIQNLRMN